MVNDNDSSLITLWVCHRAANSFRLVPKRYRNCKSGAQLKSEWTWTALWASTKTEPRVALVYSVINKRAYSRASWKTKYLECSLQHKKHHLTFLWHWNRGRTVVAVDPSKACGAIGALNATKLVEHVAAAAAVAWIPAFTSDILPRYRIKYE